VSSLYDLLKLAGLNIKKNNNIKPTLPYGIYTEDVSTFGADDHPDLLASTDITILWAAEKIDFANEALIENCIVSKGLNYRRTRDWLDTEKMYQTTYDISLYAKKG
jgi:hypothetical protein